jgi:hypothetical protein
MPRTPVLALPEISLTTPYGRADYLFTEGIFLRRRKWIRGIGEKFSGLDREPVGVDVCAESVGRETFL